MRRALPKVSKSFSQAGSKKSVTVRVTNGGKTVRGKASVKTR